MKISLEKTKNIFYSFVRILVFCVFFLVVYYILVDMVGMQLYDSRGMMFGSKKQILISLLLLSTYIYLIYSISKIEWIVWNSLIERIVLFIFFLLCCFFSYYFANDGLYEIGVVYDAGEAIYKGTDCEWGALDFLSRYSYLRPIVCYAGLFMVGGKTLLSLIMCLGMTLGLYSSLKLIKILDGNKSTLYICSSLFYISMPIFLSCSIFYNFSTVFWMPITMIMLYLSRDGSKKDIFRMIGFIIIASLGMSIFSIVAVVLIAVSIDMILNNRKKVVFLVAASVLGMFCLNKISYFIVDKTLFNTAELREAVENNEIPMFESTLYTGLNNDSLGYYTDQDLLYILSLETYQDKKEGLHSAIKQRLTHREDMLDFILKKTSINFGQGTFYSEDVSNNGLLKERELIKYFSKDYPEVIYYKSFFCAMNIIFLCMMLWLIVSKKKQYNLLYLSILGAWMVTLLSETDSRHVFPFLPLFIVMASCGACDICEKRTNAKIIKTPSKKGV